MDKELYNRQEALKLTQLKSAIVVGCGGTGFWTAYELAASGCENLVLFDDDVLEPSNFNRLPLNPTAYVGRNKAEATREFIENCRPDCIVRTEGKATEYSLETAEGEFLFDCTDSQAVQTFLSDWCKKKKVKYIRAGYDGTHFTTTSHVSVWNTNPDPRAGYRKVPSWVCPAIIPATLAVTKAMYAPDLDVSLDLKDIGGK